VKTLLVLRHAKSSWDDPGLSDHDRPLNKRGRRDAPRMGELMDELDILPDIIFSSTAVRARTTAVLFADACGFGGEILLDDELYHAAPAEYLRTLSESAGGADCAMVVGHNPGIQELVAVLTGAHERMPTAALACIELAIDDWREVASATGTLAGVWRPKELG